MPPDNLVGHRKRWTLHQLPHRSQGLKGELYWNMSQTQGKKKKEKRKNTTSSPLETSTLFSLRHFTTLLFDYLTFFTNLLFSLTYHLDTYLTYHITLLLFSIHLNLYTSLSTTIRYQHLTFSLPYFLTWSTSHNLSDYPTYWQPDVFTFLRSHCRYLALFTTSLTYYLTI